MLEAWEHDYTVVPTSGYLSVLESWVDDVDMSK